jgi:hypothetical protein
MSVFQTTKSFQCRHDAHPQKCVHENCPNWNGLQKDDIRSIFGKQSSSVLAARYCAEHGLPAYQALRRTAMEQGLIPMEKIPVSLIPPQ